MSSTIKTLSLFIALCFCYLFSLPSFSQEVDSETEEQHGIEQEVDHSEAPEHGEFKHHVLGFSIGHTHVSNGVRDGDNKWLALPSFAISYSYFFNHK